MKRKRYAKEPLPYIHQPTRQKPEARMQQNYFSAPKSVERDEPEVAPVPYRRRRGGRRNFFIDPIDDEDELEYGEQKDDEQIATAEEEEVSQDQVVKNSRFNDLSITDKVTYFINMPGNAPVVRCEVLTEERKYRGTIVDSKDDLVLMRVGRRASTTEIPLKDIQEISLLGF